MTAEIIVKTKLNGQRRYSLRIVNDATGLAFYNCMTFNIWEALEEITRVAIHPTIKGVYR